MAKKDPYPAIGTNYRPPIETYTTNRGLKKLLNFMIR